MTQDFDKLIASAAPEVPDCGESRRTARALMNERVRLETQRQRTRHLRRISVAAGLVFVVMMGGQLSELGSDGFDFKMGTLELSNGETVPQIVNTFRGAGAGITSKMTEDELYEFQQQILLREGTIESITGLSFNDAPPQWFINYLIINNGKVKVIEREPLGLSVENMPISRDKVRFLIDELDSFMELVASGQIAGKPYDKIAADGVTFEVRQWSKQYPQWGLFTYYRGEPVVRAD